MGLFGTSAAIRRPGNCVPLAPIVTPLPIRTALVREQLDSVSGLRTGQIGDGLGPRATLYYDDSILT